MTHVRRLLSLTLLLAACAGAAADETGGDAARRAQMVERVRPPWRTG